MINAIAIDDEPYAIEVIKSLARKVPFLKLNRCFHDGIDAIDYLSTHPIDMMFLDINMPNISGIELIEQLPQRPKIVFTTAYSEYALKSYELNAVDYLLKPFGFPRFLQACNKVQDLLALTSEHKVTTDIFIKAGYELIKVKAMDILFLESTGNYITFVMIDDQRIVSRLTINEAFTLLSSPTFARVHRSYIVNQTRIDKLERQRLQIKGYVIPVSNIYFFNLNNLKSCL